MNWLVSGQKITYFDNWIINVVTFKSFTTFTSTNDPWTNRLSTTWMPHNTETCCSPKWPPGVTVLLFFFIVAAKVFFFPGQLQERRGHRSVCVSVCACCHSHTDCLSLLLDLTCFILKLHFNPNPVHFKPVQCRSEVCVCERGVDMCVCGCVTLSGMQTVTFTVGSSVDR